MLLLGRLVRPPRRDPRSSAVRPWRLRALQAGAVVFATVLFVSLLELML